MVDVRSALAFAAGRVPGARSVPLATLSEAVRDGALDAARGKRLVLVGAGTDAAQACVRLSRVFAFEDVAELQGGMDAWRAAGLAVEP